MGAGETLTLPITAVSRVLLSPTSPASMRRRRSYLRRLNSSAIRFALGGSVDGRRAAFSSSDRREPARLCWRALPREKPGFLFFLSLAQASRRNLRVWV